MFYIVLYAAEIEESNGLKRSIGHGKGAMILRKFGAPPTWQKIIYYLVRGVPETYAPISKFQAKQKLNARCKTALGYVLATSQLQISWVCNQRVLQTKD